MSSPFPSPACIPGSGSLHLTLLPPANPTFTTLSYTYPLKLLPSNPHILSHASSTQTDEHPSRHVTPKTVPLLFLLTYGGGLLHTDHITLAITLAASARLTIATQGSTKIYKPEHPSSHPPPLATQTLHCTLHPHSALFYAPHPTQPFAGSHYAQTQIFELHEGASLGMLDWVSEGRSARQESWAFGSWKGKNEVWLVSEAESSSHAPSKEGEKKRRLLLRDNVVLSGPQIKARMESFGLFGTLILVGPLLQPLADFMCSEFDALPRLGGRNWDTDSSTTAPKLEAREKWRMERQEREKRDGLIWTVAKVRGGKATVVKFGAADVEGGREWLGAMLKMEGTVGREFGPGGLMGVS